MLAVACYQWSRAAVDEAWPSSRARPVAVAYQNLKDAANIARPKKPK